MSMKHPEDTHMRLLSKEDITKTALEYCVNLLTNRDPLPHFKIDKQLKDVVHETRMIAGDDDTDCLKLTREMYKVSLQEIGSKKKEKYQFILNAGDDLYEALLHIFQLVWTSEVKPDQRRNTNIIQLYKGKGDRDEFASH